MEVLHVFETHCMQPLAIKPLILFFLSPSDHRVKRIGCEEDAATFQIEETANLSEVFRKMEQLAKDEFESLHICNYSVSQASLEQVRIAGTPIHQQLLSIIQLLYFDN